MGQLKDRTALIIGSATGIGRAVALSFAAEGANVIIADRKQAIERAALVKDIKKTGKRAIDCHCDVMIEEDVQAALATALKFGGGRLDILVNNAGIGLPMTNFADMNWADWQRVMDINLRGVAYGMHNALPIMLKQGYGRIINTASQLAHKPAAQASAYSASKAAIVALSTAVAQEVASKGVTVNCVCPGPTDTASWRSSDPIWTAKKVADLPISRVASPEEIAPAYVFLASSDASFMIGQSVSPNGGDVSW
ncbi:SDR family NAD(P)-dependent oxidoreductase [Brucella pseudogrignonensis]|uniref:SDR family NAD(P)-dependent oxidoreductase n=1 Tax=Brucella pseudogrignonensis TaxID=419475 RepID=UPI003ED10805